jgi:chemotaxis protein CheX
MVLPDTLDLKAAGPLTTALLAGRGQDLSLDGRAVQRLGAQCLQVLLAARATWAADGHALTITDPSPEFAEAAAQLGAPELIA